MKIIVFIGLFLFSALAFAEENVQTLNQNGLTAFSEGRYIAAAELFARAYALQPRPELLKNRAVSLYRANRCEEALPVALTYLKEDSTTPAEKQQVNSLKDGCYVLLAEKAVLMENFELANELVNKAEKQAELKERVAVVKKAIADNEAAKASKLVLRNEPTKQIEIKEVIVPSQDNDLSWVLIGIGTATLLGTVVYHSYEKFVTEAEFESVGMAGSQRARYDQLDRRLRVSNWLVPSLYAVGFATTGVGVSLQLFPTDNEKSVPGVAWRASF